MITDGELRRLGLRAPAVSLYGPLCRVALTVGLLGVIVGQTVVYWKMAQSTLHSRRMADFGVFYESAERARTSAPPYSPKLSPDGRPTRPPNLAPPHVIAALVPISALPPAVALAIWALASLLSAGAAVVIILREAGIGMTPRSTLLTAAAIASAAPTGALVYSAQVTWLLWGPAALAWSQARRGHWLIAAALLGALASAKPFLLLFVPVLVAERRLRAAAVLLVTAVACLLAGVVALGLDAFSDWVELIRAVSWAGHVWNGSLLGFVQRTLQGSPPSAWELAPLLEMPSWVAPAWIGVATATLLFAARALRQSRPDSPVHVDRLFAIALTTSFLLSPLAWVYYDALLAAPFVALVAAPAWRSRGRVAAIAVAAVFLTATPAILIAAQPNGLATITIGSLYFWALVLLWAASVSSLETTIDTPHAVRLLPQRERHLRADHPPERAR